MTLTKPDILAALGAGGVTSMPMLRQAFGVFVQYPDSEAHELAGFDGADDMVDVFSRVCWALRSDGENMPGDVVGAVGEILSSVRAARVPSAQFNHAAEALGGFAGSVFLSRFQARAGAKG